MCLTQPCSTKQQRYPSCTQGSGLSIPRHFSSPPNPQSLHGKPAAPEGSADQAAASFRVQETGGSRAVKLESAHVLTESHGTEAVKISVNVQATSLLIIYSCSVIINGPIRTLVRSLTGTQNSAHGTMHAPRHRLACAMRAHASTFEIAPPKHSQSV